VAAECNNETGTHAVRRSLKSSNFHKKQFHRCLPLKQHMGFVIYQLYKILRTLFSMHQTPVWLQTLLPCLHAHEPYSLRTGFLFFQRVLRMRLFSAIFYMFNKKTKKTYLKTIKKLNLKHNFYIAIFRYFFSKNSLNHVCFFCFKNTFKKFKIFLSFSLLQINFFLR
jgi:hypothetical protein